MVGPAPLRFQVVKTVARASTPAAAAAASPAASPTPTNAKPAPKPDPAQPAKAAAPAAVPSDATVTESTDPTAPTLWDPLSDIIAKISSGGATEVAGTTPDASQERAPWDPMQMPDPVVIHPQALIPFFVTNHADTNVSSAPIQAPVEFYPPTRTHPVSSTATYTQH